MQCMFSINLSVTLSSQSVLSKCTYDTVVHKLQRSAVMYACIFAFSLAVVDVECMRVVHVSHLRCKKHARKHQSEVKLNHRREITMLHAI